MKFFPEWKKRDTFPHHGYISLDDASKKYGVNSAYLRVLISRNRLRAVKIGKMWVTTAEWMGENPYLAKKIAVSRRDAVFPAGGNTAADAPEAPAVFQNRTPRPVAERKFAFARIKFGNFTPRRKIAAAVFVVAFFFSAVLWSGVSGFTLRHPFSRASIGGALGDFLISVPVPPSPRVFLRGAEENLFSIFTNTHIPATNEIFTALRGLFDNILAIRIPFFSSFFGITSPPPVAIAPAQELQAPAGGGNKEQGTQPEEINMATTSSPSASNAVPSAPAVAPIREVITRKEIVAPADVSSFQTKLDALNSYILTQFSRVNTSLADLGVQLDSKTSFTTFARSEKIDQLIAPSILSGLTLSGDLSSTGGFTFSGSGRINGGLTVDGALSSGALSASSGTFSGSLTVAGDLTVSGAQTLSGAITIPYFTATSTTATSTIATGGFAVGTSQFVVQQTSGNVGIGTSSPGAALAISASQASAFEALRIINQGGNNNSYISFPAAFSGGKGLTIGEQFVPSGGRPFIRTAGGYSQSIQINAGTDNTDTTGILYLNTSGTGGIIQLGTTTQPDSGSPIVFQAHSGQTQNLFKVTNSSGSSSFFDITSAGSIGIGTTSPGSLLSVNGAILAQTGTSTFGGLISPTLFSTTTLGFYTASNATPQMTIDASGNVGVGTAAPGAKLDISTPNSEAIYALISAAVNRLQLGYIAGGTTPDNNVNQAQISVDSTGNLLLSSRTNNPSGLKFYTNAVASAVERMTILTNGNVGIGTTNPGYGLSASTTLGVSGNVTFSGLNTSSENVDDSIIIRTSSNQLITDTALKFNPGGDVLSVGTSPIVMSANIIRTSGTDDLILTVANFNPSGVRISGATGNVGIGTTSPGSLLSVNGPILAQTGTSTFGGLISPTLFSTTTLGFYTGSNASPAMTIDTSGNVGIGTTSPNQLLHLYSTFPNSANIQLESGDNTRSALIYMKGGPASVNWLIGTQQNYLSNALIFRNGSPGAEQMVIQTAGNVGIGTTTPGSLLSVNGPILAQTGTSTFGGLISPTIFSTTTLGFYTASNATPQMTIDTSGNVAIGTTTTGITFFGQPSGTKILNILGSGQNAFLSLGNDAAVNDGDLLAQIQAGAASYNTAAKRTSAVIRFYADGTTAGNRGGAITFDTHPNGDTGNGALERMRITNSGNVGIGTSTPLRIFSVASANVSGVSLDETIANSAGFIVGSNNSTNDWFVGRHSFAHMNGTTMGVGTLSATPVELFTNDTERMRILSSGNVGIGTTTPADHLTVAGTGEQLLLGGAGVGTSVTYGRVLTTGGDLLWGVESSVGGAFFPGSTAYAGVIDTNNNTPLQFGTNNVARMTINTSGNVGIGTTSPWGLLSVNPNGITGPAFVIGSSTATNFIVTNAGNVGIGTAAPVGDLDVTKGKTGTASIELRNTTAGTTNRAELSVGNDADANLMTIDSFSSTWTTVGPQLPNGVLMSGFGVGGLGLRAQSASGNIYFYTGGTTERMRIDSSGNVGIGTTSPQAKLTVEESTGVVNPGLIIGGQLTAVNAGHSIDFRHTSNSASYARIAGVTDSAGSTGQLSFWTSAGLNTAATQKVLIDSGGNVGIGTTNLGSCGGTCIAIHNLTPNAPSAVANQGILYVNSGALEYQGPTTLTQLAAADYAEAVPFRGVLDAADIVSVSPIPKTDADIYNNFFVEQSSAPYQKSLVGVVSSSAPDTATSTRMIALVGRVPVKVSTEAGPIKIGDRITSSSLPGVGMKATVSGETVGIALEPFDGSSATTTGALPDGTTVSTGKILVFVNLGYAKLDDAVAQLPTTNYQLQTNAWSVSQTSGKVNVNFFGDVSLNGNAIINVSKIIGMWGKWTIDENGVITAAKVIADEAEVNKLAVGSHTSPAGVTLYDRVTGEPFCAFIANGAWRTERGACDSTSLAAGGSQPTPHQSSQSADGTGQATNPPMPSAPEGAATATTTDNVQPTPNQTAGTDGTGQATSNLQLTTDNAQLTTGTATTTEATSTTP